MHTDGHVDDEMLLMQIQQGSEKAFTQLYEKYANRIYINLIKLVKDRDVAQELLQDVFLKIWDKKSTITIEKSFPAYLNTIARNLAFNFSKRISLNENYLTSVIQHNPSQYSHVEENIMLNEIQSLYDQAIAELPPKRKSVYLLCKVEGKSYDEAAQILGLSSSTISDHMVKATRFIKNRISKSECFGYVFLYFISNF
ncbi:RNA polymerase sigma factor [Sphingobacterium sp. HJSM2_6]|uniref:RNA polymerase sigma factor n=1 Tax=Sphingobacterium sp. HJSM2_6 TaxID=3366264 RepID=UPI003BE4BB53